MAVRRTRRCHDGHFEIFDGRKGDEKGLLVVDFSLSRGKWEKSRAKGEESSPFGVLLNDFSLTRSREEKSLSRVMPFYGLFSGPKSRNPCREGLEVDVSQLVTLVICCDSLPQYFPQTSPAATGNSIFKLIVSPQAIAGAAAQNMTENHGLLLQSYSGRRFWVSAA